MPLEAGFWVIAGTSLGAFLVAAKTHGRQVRLERELHGFWNVDFAGANPPFVESLWRMDRLRFWLNVARVSPFFAFGLSAWAAADLSLPGVARPTGLWDLVAVLLVSVALWTPTVAFLLNARTSHARLVSAMAQPHPDVPGVTRLGALVRERPDWARASHRGTWVWAVGCALAVGAVIGMVAGGL